MKRDQIMLTTYEKIERIVFLLVIIIGLGAVLLDVFVWKP